MFQVHHLMPEGMFARVIGGNPIYSSVIVVEAFDHQMRLADLRALGVVGGGGNQVNGGGHDQETVPTKPGAGIPEGGECALDAQAHRKGGHRRPLNGFREPEGHAALGVDARASICRGDG